MFDDCATRIEISEERFNALKRFSNFYDSSVIRISCGFTDGMNNFTATLFSYRDDWRLIERFA